MLYLSTEVGGTFTDLVLIDTESGEMLVDKVPSSGRRADSVTAGVARVLKRAESSIESLSKFIHGSTITTNAMLTRTGASAVLVTTKGFRDVLEIGNQRRPKLYSLSERPRSPLIPRSRVVEVAERMDAFGEVVTPLSDSETERVVQQLVSMNPEAIAVSLLFGYQNSAHESALARRIRLALPNVPVYVSSEINPQVDEYLRTNTTCAAAYVGPEIDAYLTSLEGALKDAGLKTPTMLMRSDGGVATPAGIRKNPATMLLSGPAGGVIASAALGEAIRAENIVTFDMGGTSADFSLISGGRPSRSSERVLTGEVLRFPMLDIETISSGGGSIAAVDHAGALNVGPHSAGAVPGPACYSKGGELPTLTDALVH
jgi:N-methylhydantoinase A